MSYMYICICIKETTTSHSCLIKLYFTSNVDLCNSKPFAAFYFLNIYIAPLVLFLFFCFSNYYNVCKYTYMYVNWSAHILLPSGIS